MHVNTDPAAPSTTPTHSITADLPANKQAIASRDFSHKIHIYTLQARIAFAGTHPALVQSTLPAYLDINIALVGSPS